MKRLLFYIIFATNICLCTAQNTIHLDYNGSPMTCKETLKSKSGQSQDIDIKFSFNKQTNQIKLSITPKYMKNKNRAIWFPSIGCSSNVDSILNLCRKDLPMVTSVSPFYRSQGFLGIKCAFGTTNCSLNSPLKNAIIIDENPQPIEFSFKVENPEEHVHIELQNASVSQRSNIFTPKKQKLYYISNSLSWEFIVDIPPCETQIAKQILNEAELLNENLIALDSNVKALIISRSQLDDNKKPLETLRAKLDTLGFLYDKVGEDCPNISNLLDTISENIKNLNKKLNNHGKTQTRQKKDSSNNVSKILNDLKSCINVCKASISSDEDKNKAKIKFKETVNDGRKLYNNMTSYQKNQFDRLIDAFNAL